MLLERSHHVAALDESLATVLASSRGRLELVGGEAGVGKTALVRRFCDVPRRSVRVVWGGCDALFTPRPLGPLLDVARQTHGELEELVESGARPHDVAASLMRELGTRPPAILVLEDVHWADEATLDVLRLLGRRVEAVAALVLATYRDDELDRGHPLRIVLGELATSGAVGRVSIEPLSPAAVAELAGPHAVDAEALYRKTNGNPFFVTEVLAAGEQGIPDTVRDAVLARVARLSPAAGTLLDGVAIVPPQAELWLVDALAGDAGSALEECLTSGVLRAEPGGVAFRHELARLALEESLAPDRRIALHEKALAALAAPPAGAPGLARLAHHAEAAGDSEAVLRFAPRAAARASSLGAHREAAAHYARALRFAGDLPTAARGDLLEVRAHECYLSGALSEAIGAGRQAAECHRELGDRRREGDCLRLLSWPLWVLGRIEEAWESARQAVALLESLPPGRELAMAYATLANLPTQDEDQAEVIAAGERALELARWLDDKEILVHAQIGIGTLEFLRGVPGGREKLERGLELAREGGFEDQVARAFCTLALGASRQRAYPLAERYIRAGSEYCIERDLDSWRPYLVALRARVELERGRWDEAADSAALVLRARGSGLASLIALVTLGLVRARRGDPGAWPVLDEARDLAEPTRELSRIAPVAAARAEAAWLGGMGEAVPGATDAALDLALRRRSRWVIGELACWRRRAGIQEPSASEAAEPYALQIAGDWARAAELWTELGCPYETALALADADDDDALRRSLETLQRLDARPAAAIVARRLRERGARGVPRGPRPRTRENTANLTPREIEVLELVAQGLHNAEIAARLFVSKRTVDHHVSAILHKLDVPSRGQAVAEAARLGIAGPT